MSKRRRNAPIEVSMITLVALTQDTPVLVEQNHVRHAAHYAYNHPVKGHDLDRWVVRSQARPTFEQLAALGLPSDAEWHTGYRDSGTGPQHWVYIAKRPLSEGMCERCAAMASERLFAQRGLS